MLEKFDKRDKLVRAYTELEKDYTRKCQELAKLKHEELVENLDQVEEKYSDFGTIGAEDALLDSETNDFVQPPKSELDTAAADNTETQQEPLFGSANLGQGTPVYLLPTWISDAKEFFAGHSLAACFERDILEKLASDKTLSCSTGALETAAALALGDMLLKDSIDPKMAEALSELAPIKNACITEYLASLRGRKNAPPRVETKAQVLVASGRPKYSSIREAGNSLLGRI